MTQLPLRKAGSDLPEGDGELVDPLYDELVVVHDYTIWTGTGRECPSLQSIACMYVWITIVKKEVNWLQILEGKNLKSLQRHKKDSFKEEVPESVSLRPPDAKLHLFIKMPDVIRIPIPSLCVLFDFFFITSDTALGYNRDLDLKKQDPDS